MDRVGQVGEEPAPAGPAGKMRSDRPVTDPRIHALLALATASLGIGACKSDVFDVDVDLAPHAYPADFGPSNGTIPTVACSAATPSVCGVSQMLSVSTDVAPADVSVVVGCDAAAARCYAEAHASLGYQLDVLQDDAFVTKVERRAISAVRNVDLAYTMPVNTLTFAIPRVDVYVGPAGAKTPTDPGVVLVDSVSSIAPGETFVAERRHLTLAQGSPARALVESNIQNKQPFVFVVATAPRLEAGAPMPGGGFQIDIYPRLGLGLE
jgi:hypothetical protein